MNRELASPEKEGFYGAWYPNPAVQSGCAMILMLGDSSTDRMAVCGAKWFHRHGVHALAMSPDVKDYGHHNYPLERFGRAVDFLRARGCDKIGIVGASTTGMLALVAASFYPDISLTVAVSPSDFIMEGFYRDGKDGMAERPGDGESSVSWQGAPLPYLPYAYRHPDYWLKLKEEAKAGGDMAAARRMFDESERRHPLREEELIRVERIHGRIVCIGAEDDVLWDTCRYIRRMQRRLDALPHDSAFEAWLYPRGTHFAFPQSMLRMMLPVGSSLLVGAMFRAGRRHPRACKQTRQDIDRRMTELLRDWRGA